MKLREFLQLIGSLLVLIFVAAALVSFASFLFSEPKTGDEFAIAQDGEYWIISQAGVDLLKEPEWPSNDADWERRSLGSIPAGSIVEIINTKGFGGAWKQVYVLDQDKRPGATGWIYFELVKDSKNLGKSIPN